MIYEIGHRSHDAQGNYYARDLSHLQVWLRSCKHKSFHFFQWGSDFPSVAGDSSQIFYGANGGRWWSLVPFSRMCDWPSSSGETKRNNSFDVTIFLLPKPSWFQDLMKSNFIFVYNMPTVNFTKKELLELTDSTNILFLPQSSTRWEYEWVSTKRIKDFFITSIFLQPLCFRGSARAIRVGVGPNVNENPKQRYSRLQADCRWDLALPGRSWLATSKQW